MMVIIMLCLLANHAIHTSQSKEQTEKITYNAQATQELNRLYNEVEGSRGGAILKHTRTLSFLWRYHQDVIRLLRVEKANPNEIRNDPQLSCYPMSMLEKAVFEDDFEIVHACLQQGANTNPPFDEVHPPLLSNAKSVRMAQLLVNNGAQLNSSDKLYDNLLYLAIRYGRPKEVVIFFYDNGVNYPNCKIDIDQIGKTITKRSRARPSLHIDC
jgi:hypothetical protein